MDLTKFIYSDIGPDILDRLYNEGKEIKAVGNLNDFLNLPIDDKLIENDCKGYEESKDDDDLKVEKSDNLKKE